MAGHRLERVTEDAHREIADILREMKDPRVNGMITVVKVNVSGDLSIVTVYISALSGIEAAKEAVAVLKKAGGFVRTELGKRLKIRKTPELRFVADDSILLSAKIAQIMKSEDFSRNDGE
ncbi:MAG: 30S ribosome-binding factor RbfA [Oscillospiraceae bacterium]|nr:30S ribosome-binding factor RbfA [Oscillospiraceae bacterium]